MARGHQKIQSQQKNAKKQAEMKKAKGHDQKTAAKAALVFTCAVCKVSTATRNPTEGGSPILNQIQSLLLQILLSFNSCWMFHLFSQSQMPDPKTFKQHFESKHPKSPLPPELEGVEA